MGKKKLIGLQRGSDDEDWLFGSQKKIKTRGSVPWSTSKKSTPPLPKPQTPSTGEYYFLTIFVRYDDNPDLNNWRNRITAWVTGSPIIHCETYFPIEDMTFSITTQNQAGWYSGKLFTRSWETLRHDVTKEQYEATKRLMEKYRGWRFDNRGWRWGVFCHTSACTSNYGKTMCSRLIAEVYSNPDVGLIDPDDVMPTNEATPALIYEILEKQSRGGVIPKQIERAMAQGLFLQ